MSSLPDTQPDQEEINAGDKPLLPRMNDVPDTATKIQDSIGKNKYRRKLGICFVLRLLFVSFRVEVSKEEVR